MDKAELTIFTRGKGKGAVHWLSELAENGEASGWSLVYGLSGVDNAPSADAIIGAMEEEGLLRKGERVRDFSGDAWLSFQPALQKEKFQNHLPKRHFMWHITDGSRDRVLELMELAR